MNNYNQNNLKNSERKLKIFTNDLLPFVKQMVLIMSVNDVFENDFSIIETPTKKTKFHSDCEKEMKSDFELNQDQFNIENSFFKFKSKQTVTKNKKAKNIILNSIVIENNRTEYYVTFNTKFKTVINNKLEVFEFKFKIVIGKIDLKAKTLTFLTYTQLFEKFKELEQQYSTNKINKLTNVYTEYLKEKNVFELKTKEFEKAFKDKDLEIMLNDDFNSLSK